MTLHQLKLLCALARHRSLTRVGEELFLSQPAVTLQLQALQREAGVALYERLGKTLHLTDAGQTLARYAQRILALVEEAESAVQALHQSNGGRVRVGASNTPGIYLLPPLLSGFHREYPTVHLTIEVANTQLIAEKILRNELDLGVVGGALDRRELTIVPWMIDTLVLVVSVDHPWAQKKVVSPEELQTEQLLGRELGSATRQTYEQAFLQRGLTLPQTIEIGGVEAIKRAVEAGLGVAILSTYSVAREVEDGRVAIVSFKDFPISRPLSVIYHKDKALTAPMRELLRRLERVAQSERTGRRRSRTGQPASRVSTGA